MTDPPGAGGGMAAKAEAAQEGARHVAGEAKQQAGQVAGEARAQARHVVDRALGQAREQSNQQAARAAGTLRSVSDHLRALSEGRSQEAGRLGELAAQAGDRVQQFAGRLDERGLQGVADDLNRFARRRPGLFLAAAAGLGFVVGRALRARQASASGGPGGGRADYSDVAPMYGDVDVSLDVPPAAVTPGAGAPSALPPPDMVVVPGTPPVVAAPPVLDPLLSEQPFDDDRGVR